MPHWAVWSASLLFFGAFYTLLVPIPLYLEAIGLPDWQIGFVLGAFGVASLFGRPLAGAVNDSLGSRAVILFGTVALAAGAALMSFASSPALLFGLRILQAGGYVTFTTAATALVADLSPPARRGAALALFGVAANLAITLTPATVSAGMEQLTLLYRCPTDPCPMWCGGMSARVDGSAGILCPLWGWGVGHSAFWLSGGLSLLAGVFIWRAVPVGAGFAPTRRSGACAGHPVGRTARPSSFRAWLRRLTGLVSALSTGRSLLPPPLRGPMLTTWLFGVSFGAFLAFLPLLAARRAFAPVGAAYGVYGISIIATRILTGRLLDRPERARALVPSLLVNAVGLMGFAFAGTMPALLGSAALMGVGSGITHPALIAICVDRMADTQRGRATSSFYLAFDLGIGLGSWLLGLALESIGMTGLYVTASLVSVVGALSAPLLSGNTAVAT